MYLVLSALTSSPISLVAATNASAFSFKVCAFTYVKYTDYILYGIKGKTGVKLIVKVPNDLCLSVRKTNSVYGL